MNLKYMKVSLFEISYKKKMNFHDILIYWDAPVFLLAFGLSQKCSSVNNISL